MMVGYSCIVMRPKKHQGIALDEQPARTQNYCQSVKLSFPFTRSILYGKIPRLHII